MTNAERIAAIIFIVILAGIYATLLCIQSIEKCDEYNYEYYSTAVTEFNTDLDKYSGFQPRESVIELFDLCGETYLNYGDNIYIPYVYLIDDINDYKYVSNNNYVATDYDSLLELKKMIVDNDAYNVVLEKDGNDVCSRICICKTFSLEESNNSEEFKGNEIKEKINSYIDYYNEISSQNVENLKIKFNFPNFYLDSTSETDSTSHAVIFDSCTDYDNKIIELKNFSDNFINENHYYRLIYSDSNFLINYDYLDKNIYNYKEITDEKTKTTNYYAYRSLNETEIEDYLSQFEKYEGRISGSQVKEFLNLYISIYNEKASEDFLKIGEISDYVITRIKFDTYEESGKGEIQVIGTSQTYINDIKDLMKKIVDTDNYYVEIKPDDMNFVLIDDVYIYQDGIELEADISFKTVSDGARQNFMNTIANYEGKNNISDIITLMKYLVKKCNSNIENSIMNDYFPKLEFVLDSGEIKETLSYSKDTTYFSYCDNYINICNEIINLLNSDSTYNVTIEGDNGYIRTVHIEKAK